MKSVLYRMLQVLLIISLLSLPSYARGEWKLVKDSKGIKVYNRDVKGSKYKEVKAVAIINQPPEVVLEVILDVPIQPEWMPDIKEASFIEKLDDYNWFSLHIFSCPWPVSDRDIILKVESKLDFKNGIYLIDFASPRGQEGPEVPLHEKRVRGICYSGKWDFKRTEHNRTLFIYQNNFDLRSHIPGFLVDRFAKKMPFGTVKGMKKMVIRAKYIEAAKKRAELLKKQNIEVIE